MWDCFLVMHHRLICSNIKRCRNPHVCCKHTNRSESWGQELLKMFVFNKTPNWSFKLWSKQRKSAPHTDIRGNLRLFTQCSCRQSPDSPPCFPFTFTVWTWCTPSCTCVRAAACRTWTSNKTRSGWTAAPSSAEWRPRTQPGASSRTPAGSR